MDFKAILEPILITLITTAITTAAGFLCRFIAAKIKEVAQKTDNDNVKKLLSIGETIIVDTINAATQTTVDSLKKEGLFTKEAQQKVFSDVKNSILNSFGSDVIKAFENTYNVPIGNYLDTKIESVIAENK